MLHPSVQTLGVEPYFSSWPRPRRSSRFSSMSFLLLISSFLPPFLSVFLFLKSAKNLTYTTAAPEL